MLFKNACIRYYFEIYTTDKDLPTCVWGQAKDLTSAQNLWRGVYVWMKVNLSHKYMNLHKEEVRKTLDF